MFSARQQRVNVVNSTARSGEEIMRGMKEVDQVFFLLRCWSHCAATQRWAGWFHSTGRCCAEKWPVRHQPRSVNNEPVAAYSQGLPTYYILETGVQGVGGHFGGQEFVIFFSSLKEGRPDKLLSVIAYLCCNEWGSNWISTRGEE